MNFVRFHTLCYLLILGGTACEDSKDHEHPLQAQATSHRYQGGLLEIQMSGLKAKMQQPNFGPNGTIIT